MLAPEVDAAVAQPAKTKVRIPARYKQPKLPSKKPARRYRSYATPEKMRAAFLAGSGKTSAEIAEALGSTTARKVRDVLRSYQIKLTRPFDRPKTIQIHCSNDDLRLLEFRADEVEYDAADLALAILRAVLAEPVVMRNLINEAA